MWTLDRAAGGTRMRSPYLACAVIGLGGLFAGVTRTAGQYVVQRFGIRPEDVTGGFIAWRSAAPWEIR